MGVNTNTKTVTWAEVAKTFESMDLPPPTQQLIDDLEAATPFVRSHRGQYNGCLIAIGGESLVVNRKLIESTGGGKSYS